VCRLHDGLAISLKIVAQGLIETFAPTAVHLQLLTNGSALFRGKLFQDVVKMLDIELMKTTPYHPQVNEAVEWLIGTVKPSLTKQIALGIKLMNALPLVMYQLWQIGHASLCLSL